MALRELLERWPVVRQLREGDPLGLGARGRSRRARETLKPADRRRRPRRRSRSARTAPSAAASSSTSRTARSTQIEGDPAARSRAAGSARRARRRRARARARCASTRSSTGARTGREWEELTLDAAMEMIADRVVETRAATLAGADRGRHAANRTIAIAHLGGATLDNEENYLIKKSHGTRRRAGREPARI